MSRRLQFSRPIVCYISTGSVDPAKFDLGLREMTAKAAAARDAGVSMFQIREKHLDRGLLYELTRAVVAAVSGAGVTVIVNGRPDVASAAGADGVHLPANGLPVEEVRANFSTLAVGVSCHSVDEVRAAGDAGADYAFLSPIFATPGKGEPLGLETLKETVEAAGDLPLIGLGGVDDANSAKILAAGAAGFAAIRYLDEKLARLVAAHGVRY